MISTLRFHMLAKIWAGRRSALLIAAILLLGQILARPAALGQPPEASGSTPEDIGGNMGGYLQQADAALEQLDSLARECQRNLESMRQDDGASSGSTPGPNCRDFLRAMHGDTWSTYRAACDEAEQWVDGLSPEAETEASATLRLVLETRRLCSSGALGRESEVIAPVYSDLDTISRAHRGDNASTYLDELEFQARLWEQRQRLEQSLDRSRRQQERMADELYRRQERDLLRRRLE